MASPPIFPCRNPSVFYSPVQMPLFLGSPLLQSTHPGERPKKTPIHLLFGLCFLDYCGIPFLTSTEDTHLSEDLSSSTHPLLTFWWNRDRLFWRTGVGKLVQKGNGLTPEGVFQDGKINCSSCCIQKEGPASHSCIALFPPPKGAEALRVKSKKTEQEELWAPGDCKASYPWHVWKGTAPCEWV